MNARALCSLLLVFAAADRPAAAQITFGAATALDSAWAFSLTDDPAAREPGYDDRAWSRVDLPHDWSVRGQPSPELASCTGYLPGGIGWYRKRLTIRRDPEREKVYLYFEGVYNRSDVYLNGHPLGHRPNGYVSLLYDATPYVQFDQPNTIAVRVDHSRSADSRWYPGSGINRPVFLLRANAVHLAAWGVFVRPELTDGHRGRIRIDTELRNESTTSAALQLRHEVLSADGAVVATATAKIPLQPGSSGGSTQTLDLRDAHPWTLDDPYLYRVRTTVLRDGQPVDGSEIRTGLRAFTFDPNRGFFLNGASTKMKGVCLHDDAGVLGTAVPRAVWEDRLRTLKTLGCNAVRMSHNPHAPDVYDLCDELGLLVLDEAFDEWEYPKRKWLRGWNVGRPGFEGSADFFTEWSDRDLADLVRRDRNHPSIFAWSIGNEVDYPNDPYSHPILNGTRINQPMYGGYKPNQPEARRLGTIAQRLAADVRRIDPTRPVTAALAGVVMSNETAYPSALDLTGYNYTEDRYAADHAAYPQRIIYGSENGHSLNAWRAVQDNDYIFGQFLWTGIDYLGEAGPWPSRGSTAGLLDLTGAVKPRGHFRETLWSSRPVIHLGTEPAPKDDRQSIDAWPSWNFTPGERVRVLCYTNARRARLLLDGRPLADDQPYDATTGVITWEVTFAPGQLEAIGLDENGAETCRTRLQTAGTPARLDTKADRTGSKRDGGLAILSVQVVDHEGVPVPDARNPVTCEVEGPARLLGLESSDNADMTGASATTKATFHGRLVAYIQRTGAAGPIRVRFSSPGLPDAGQTLGTP